MTDPTGHSPAVIPKSEPRAEDVALLHLDLTANEQARRSRIEEDGLGALTPPRSSR